MRRFFIAILCTLLVGITSFADAEPIAVRFAEGTTHGYLSLKTDQGRQIAHGELVQRTQGKRVEAHLFFHFLDGSVHDEKVSFSQHRLFRMEKYFLKQTGRSFPTQQEVTVNRTAKTFSFRSWVTGGTTISRSGTLSLPDDVYNGMIVTLLKNLPPGQSKTVQYVAFTPQPKLYPLKLTPTHRMSVKMGVRSKPVTQYVLEPKVGLITKLIGKIMGKLPSKFHYHFWLYTDTVPVFGAFEGPLYVNGPTWRIEQSLPNLFREMNRKTPKFLTNRPSTHRK